MFPTPRRVTHITLLALFLCRLFAPLQVVAQETPPAETLVFTFPRQSAVIENWKSVDGKDLHHVRELGYNSRNGLVVSYSTQTGETRVGVLGKAGGKLALVQTNPVALPQDYHVFDNCLSPDRTRIAWSITNYQPPNFNYVSVIWISKSDGTDAKLLWRGTNQLSIQALRWLPDSSAVSYIRDDSLYKVSMK